MKRLFGILVLVMAGVLTVGVAAWAQDDPGVTVQTASLDDPVEVVAAPAPEAAETQVSVEVVADTQPAAPVADRDTPAPASHPVEEQPVVWPIPEAPPLPPASSECEIVHAGARWGVYGVTNLPRGTVFTMTVTDGDETQTVDLVARAGGLVIRGVRYGPVDGYTDDGTTIFGPTSENMIRLDTVDGDAHATVTQGGQTICTA